jgi:predicted Ser/Thr protein kinase
MPLAPGDKLGPYEIVALIGKGGMGEVYRAHDDRLHRDVAIKVSNAQFTERFTREARTVAALNHTNIAHLYDVGPNYLVMELVEGEDPKYPLSFDDALPIIQQLIDGIEAAHEKNIIHRDLKPANIKITAEGVVKILDFGLAKAMDTPTIEADPGNSPTLTMGATAVGTILGTAAYMSPEQAKGKQADKRSDIWSFGVILHELLTGQRLFHGETAVEILGSVLNKDPDISAAPARVHKLLRYCLERDRKKRLASISDARLILDEPVNVASPAVGGTSSTAKAAWLVAAVSSLIAVAAIGFAFWPKPEPGRQALRFTVAPPPGFQLTNLFGAGTPSPDGRFIIYSAEPIGEAAKGANEPVPSLWLRPTDSLDARPLPGTEGGNLPFWSPDGKSIGFYSTVDRKLKRIEAVGGGPQVLCDVASFDGGTWSKDGVILFSLGGTIQRVAAAGGKPEPVTKNRFSLGEAARDPQFLPDGQGFLYRITTRDGNGGGIYAATLTKPDPPVPLLTSTQRKAFYAPPFAGRPGYLLWLRDQALVAQRFDPSTLKPEGDAVPIAEEVLMQPGAGGRRAAYWISENGLLAYRSGNANGLQMTWISRDGKEREPVGKLDDFGNDFRLSPDGKRVALSRVVAGNQDIWLYEFERGVMSRLTFDPAPEGMPVWSPDTRYVAYSSQRSGLPQMYRKDAGGAGQEERLHESPLPEEPKDWSRDGKFLLYMSTDPKTLADQWFLPMDGTPPRKPVVVLQTPTNEGRSRLSPDGKWVAYASGESGTNQVYIRATPGGPAGQWQVSVAGGDYPRWRGDGKELFFHSAGGTTVLAAGIKLLADRVEIETPRELFNFVGPTQGYEPTPDGQRFLALTAAGSSQGEAGARELKIISNWQALLK